MTQNIAALEAKIDWKAFWQSGAFLRVSPNEFDLYLGPFTASTEEEADLASSDYFQGSSWFKAKEVLRVEASSLRALLETQLQGRQLERADFTAPRRESFEESFRLIQGKIQRGEIEKAVPMLKSAADKRPKPADLAHMIFAMMSLPAALNVYGFWHEGVGAIGATPEQLFSMKNETLHSMALAGSAPNVANSNGLSLLKDPKELKEHQYVVDDLSQRLKSLGWMRKENTKVLELPTIMHLITPFEVNDVRKKPHDIIKHLHPTPALGVAPRAYGYQWMKELPDQVGRGQFGAPMFFRLKDRDIRVLVCIRSLFWSGKESQVFAGCGIVSDSQFENEFAEIHAKMASIYKMLGLE